MVSEEYVTAFRWATPQRHTSWRRDPRHGFPLRVPGVGIRLVDFKMDWAVRENDMMRIVVADEIPDLCRLWDIKTNDKLDRTLLP